MSGRGVGAKNVDRRSCLSCEHADTETHVKQQQVSQWRSRPRLRDEHVAGAVKGWRLVRRHTAPQGYQ